MKLTRVAPPGIRELRLAVEGKKQILIVERNGQEAFRTYDELLALVDKHGVRNLSRRSPARLLRFPSGGTIRVGASSLGQMRGLAMDEVIIRVEAYTAEVEQAAWAAVIVKDGRVCITASRRG